MHDRPIHFACRKNRRYKMSRVKVVLTDRDKKILYSGIAVLLLAAALIILGLQSFVLHKSALRDCTSILLPQSKQQCLQNLALSTGNVSVCNYALGQSRDACLAGFAEASNSLVSCGAINSSSPYYSTCIYNVSYSSDSLNGCGLLQNSSYRSECIYSIAQKLGFQSLSYCSGIENESLRNTCSDMYYYNSANARHNASYCSFLPNEQNATLLYLMSLQGPGPQASSSYSITLPLYYYIMNATPRSVCYYGLAVNMKNSSLCGFVGGSLSATCAYAVKAAQSNVSINSTLNSSAINVSAMCSSAPSYLKSYCEAGIETSMAIKDQNVGICLNMSSTVFSYSCVEAIARTYGDSSYCDYIQNATAQSACLLAAGNINSTS